MADEVEIVNFGEGGVASEATLASLVSAIEKLAASTGKDPKAAAGKLQQLHNDATKSGITIIDNFNKEKKKETTATKTAASALNKFTSRVQGAMWGAVGSVIGGMTGFANELIQGGDNLSSFSQHIPIVGKLLGPLASYLDNTAESFRSMSSVGAGFNNNLETMRLTSARMGVTLDEFQSLVVNNSDALAALGTSVNGGVMRFAAMNKNLKATGDFRQLTRLGFTVEDINEGMANYVRLQGMSGKLQNRSTSELASSSASYMETLDRLSKLTGKQRDQIAKELEDQALDASIRAMQNKFKEGSDEMQNFQTSLGIINNVGGPAGQALKDLLDGMPSSADTMTFLGMLGDAGPAVQDALKQIGDGANPQILLDALGNAGGDLETYAGLEGDARSQFVERLRLANPVMAEFLDGAGRMITQGKKTLQEVIDEQGGFDQPSEDIIQFNNAVRNLRSEIQTNFIESGLFSNLAGQMGELTKFLEDDKLKTSINNLTSDLTSGFSEVIDAFKSGGIEGALDQLLSPDGLIATALTKAMKLLFTSLTTAIVEGIKALWDSMPVVTALIGAIGTLFAAKKVVDIANGVKSLIGSDTPDRDRGRRSRGGGLGRGLGLGLKGLGSGLTALTPAIPVIGALTLAAIGLGTALRIAAPAIEAFGNVVKNVLAGAVPIIEAFGPLIESLGTAIKDSFTGVSLVVDSIGTAISSSIASVGEAISGVVNSLSEYKTAGTDATTNQIKELANIPGDNLVKAAEGIEKMKAALEGFSPGFFESFGSFLIGGQGAQDQQSQLTFITDLATAFNSFNIPSISSASEALVSMGDALKALGAGMDAQSNTGGLLGSIKTFFVGTAELPFDAIRSFEQQNFDIAKIKENAGIISQFSEIMQSMPNMPEGDNAGGLFSAIGDFFVGAEDPLAPYALFGAYSLDGSAIKSNLTTMQDFSAGINTIPQITNDLDSLITKVNMFTKTGGRGSEFNWNKIIEFGNLGLDGVTNNAQVVKDLATKISEMPRINPESLSLVSLSFVDLSKGLLALNDAAISELTIEETLVSRLERISTLGPGLGNTAESLQTLANVEGLGIQFEKIKEGLDTDAVRTYNDAIETLIDTIEDLKDSLSDVSTMQASANTAMSNIQISAQNTTDGLGRMGAALDSMISELRVANEYNKEVSRNTKGITGSNVGSGYVSKMP